MSQKFSNFYKIEYGKYSDFPSQDRKKMRSLNLRERGLMCDIIAKRKNVRVYCAFGKKRKLLGWALLDVDNSVHVYVRKSMRRNGIGKELLKCAVRWKRKKTISHYRTSYPDFFRSMYKNTPQLIKIMDIYM